MKSLMNSAFNFKYPVLILFSLLFLFSCKKDEADDDIVATRDDYLGIWYCEEYDQNQQPGPTFTVQIIKHQTDNSRVWIDNFNLLGTGKRAEAIIDNTSISIPQQTVDLFVISGSGFISNKLKTIDFQYFVDNENITAIYTKQ